jgi:hypothetical protein
VRALLFDVWRVACAGTRVAAETGDEHREKEQVQRDVERSLNSFFRGSEAQREAKRQELARIINAILATHPDLYYYQAPVPDLSLSRPTLVHLTCAVLRVACCVLRVWWSLVP